MANTHDRLLDRIRRIFPDDKPCLGGHQHGNAPRLPQLQRPGPVLVDECLLDRGSIRTIARNHIAQLIIEGQQPLSESLALRDTDTVCDMAQTRANRIDYAPARVSQPRIDTQNPHVLPCPAAISHGCYQFFSEIARNVNTDQSFHAKSETDTRQPQSDSTAQKRHQKSTKICKSDTAQS